MFSDHDTKMINLKYEITSSNEISRGTALLIQGSADKFVLENVQENVQEPVQTRISEISYAIWFDIFAASHLSLDK